MKTAIKIAVVFSTIALFLNLVAFCCTLANTKTADETGIYFTPAERYGNLDDLGTLFVTPDGNLFAVDVQYAGNAEEFLLKMDGKGTAEKTDDEILAVWQAPFLA